MKQLVEIWKDIYKGNGAWLDYSFPTLTGKKCTRKRKTLKGGYLVCAELANLIWAELPELTAGCGVITVLQENNFLETLKEQSEYLMALGGMAIKMYVEDSRIKLDFVPADRFIPISWDSTGIKEADFLDRKVVDGKQMERVERHRIKDDGYLIESEMFEEIAGERRKTKGEVEKWEVPFKMFTYIKNPMVNNFDMNSPRGISLFANSLDTLESLDIAFDALQSEIVLGRKRIIVPTSAVRQVIDTETGKPIKYFDPSDEVFQAFAGDDIEKLKITDNTSELRVEDIRTAIKTLLDILCIQIGFNTGTLSFEGQSMKTATEVISENSKTFKTKKIFEQAIGKGIIELCEITQAALDWLGYQDVAGQVTLTWDDSVIEDRNSKALYIHSRLQNNTLELWRALMLLDGIEEKEAKERAEELNKQRQVVNFDSLLDL